MKNLFLAAALFGKAFALGWDHEFSTELLGHEDMQGLFQTWRFEHAKVYDTIEDEMSRFNNFQNNMERIAASNDMYYAGEKTYVLRMNHFGDLTDAEFHDQYNCPQTGDSTMPKMVVGESDSAETDGVQGAILDWAASGYTTPVKNQESCGSCWAFSATGSMECNYAIAHNKKPPMSLSEQQLVDCAGLPYGNLGCKGGWYYNAWKYAQDAGGLCTESAYRYKGVKGLCHSLTCGLKHSKPTGYKQVPVNNELALLTAVKKGCVSIAIEADQFAFEYYSGGVLDGKCGATLDHAVLLVGYGHDLLKGDYWIVKNSWSTSWGNKGFVYICKNCGKNGSQGQCGINGNAWQVSE